MKKLTVRTNVRAGGSTSQLQELATAAYLRTLAERVRSLGAYDNNDLRASGG